MHAVPRRPPPERPALLDDPLPSAGRRGAAGVPRPDGALGAHATRPRGRLEPRVRGF